MVIGEIIHERPVALLPSPSNIAGRRTLRRFIIRTCRTLVYLRFTNGAVTRQSLRAGVVNAGHLPVIIITVEMVHAVVAAGKSALSYYGRIVRGTGGDRARQLLR